MYQLDSLPVNEMASLLVHFSAHYYFIIIIPENKRYKQGGFRFIKSANIWGLRGLKTGKIANLIIYGLGWFIKIKSDQIITDDGLLVAHKVK